MPLVSILIPCFNHGAFVDDCIQSILAQQYSNIEVIICDDCSQDDSWEKIQSYTIQMEKRLKRYIACRNENNQGLTKSLNRMLRQSQGELIKVIASDDLLMPNAISTFVDYMMKHEKCMAAVCNCYIMPEDMHYPVKEHLLKESIYKKTVDLNPENLFERLFQGNFLSAPGTIMRRTVYEKYGEYDETLYVEDWELWLRITKEHNCNIGFIDENLICYRKSAASMTSLNKNVALEQRRINLHRAEIQTIDKYGKYVSHKAYAEKKIKVIITEKSIAAQYGMQTLNSLLSQELKERKLWENVSAKQKCIFLLSIFKIYIKQYRYKE